MSPTLNKILYVEDDPDIQVVAKIALEVVGGFILRSCSSGREALEPASIDFAPDLMLLDVMMPEMDGPTTLACLRKMTQMLHTPAIFITAKVQPSEVEYLKSLGAIGVLAKPFDPMQLASQVRELWEKSIAP